MAIKSNSRMKGLTRLLEYLKPDNKKSFMIQPNPYNTSDYIDLVVAEGKKEAAYRIVNTGKNGESAFKITFGYEHLKLYGAHRNIMVLMGACDHEYPTGLKAKYLGLHFLLNKKKTGHLDEIIHLGKYDPTTRVWTKSKPHKLYEGELPTIV